MRNWNKDKRETSKLNSLENRSSCKKKLSSAKLTIDISTPIAKHFQVTAIISIQGDAVWSNWRKCLHLGLPIPAHGHTGAFPLIHSNSNTTFFCRRSPWHWQMWPKDWSEQFQSTFLLPNFSPQPPFLTISPRPPSLPWPQLIFSQSCFSPFSNPVSPQSCFLAGLPILLFLLRN